MIPALILLSLAKPTNPTSFQVQYSALADLTYELDILAGQMPWEDPSAYDSLWKSKFLLSDQDKQQFNAWKALRRSIVDRSIEEDDGPFPIEKTTTRSDLETEIRIAGFTSPDLNQYTLKLKKILPAEKVAELAQVVRYFYPKYSTWWGKEAKPKSSAFSAKLQPLLRSDKVTSRLRQFAAFYETPQAATSNLPLVLLYRPISSSTRTSGQQLANVSIVQYLDFEKPEDRIDVILHEFCHYLYGAAPKKVHVDFQSQLVKNGLEGIAAYQLFNEAMASTLGNGYISRDFMAPERFKRYLSTPLTFYYDADIDGVAKALYPVTEDLMKAGKTVRSPEFVSAYLQASKKGLGTNFLTPVRFLRSRNVLINGFDRSIGNLLNQRVKVSSASFWTNANLVEIQKDLDSSPSISSLYVLNPSFLPDLVRAGVISQGDSEKAEKQTGGAILVSKKGELAINVLLVAKDQEELNKQIERLNSLSNLTFGVQNP